MPYDPYSQPIGGSGTIGASSYDVNPQARNYDPTFGGIPGNIGLPNPYQDISGVYPNLTKTNSSVSGDIMSQLGGRLSPGTINMIQDQAAQWGAANGMPGFRPGTLGGNLGLRNLGLTSENLVNQGLQNYSHIIPTISGTQTVSPQQQADIASHNATLTSAPNPASAASYAKSLFDQYLSSLRSGGRTGGSGGPISSGGGGSRILSPSGGDAGIFVGNSLATGSPSSGSQPIQYYGGNNGPGSYYAGQNYGDLDATFNDLFSDENSNPITDEDFGF